MDIDVVNDYTWNILKIQLKKCKINGEILYKIIDNVKMQLYSILYHWNDIEFRNAILIIGSEEGSFYEPYNELVACMVVVAIRNSLIEGIASLDYLKYGVKKILDDSQIRMITSEAIDYFSKIDLFHYSSQIKIENDFYGNTVLKYPVAFKALTELSKCSVQNREHEYESGVCKKYELIELENMSDNEFKTVNCENGITSEFNSSLCNLLKGIELGSSRLFLVDSFKMLTRNFEKFLRVLDFVLTHDAIFMTCNYYISSSYVSRREVLLKASHDVNEFLCKVKKLDEISEKIDLSSINSVVK